MNKKCHVTVHDTVITYVTCTKVFKLRSCLFSEPLISPTTELLSPTSEVQTQQSSQKSYLFVMPFIFVISLLGVVGFFLHKVKGWFEDTH